jgi:hypothetical protein
MHLHCIYWGRLIEALEDVILAIPSVTGFHKSIFALFLVVDFIGLLTNIDVIVTPTKNSFNHHQHIFFIFINAIITFF